MAKGKAPGRYHRKGITLIELFSLFPDEQAAEAWFVAQRWPDGIVCPKCGSTDTCERKNRKPQPYRCRSCRKDFSVKVGTVMHGSKLSLRTWAIAIYALTTNIKGISSMKLHRDLGVRQATAWHLLHRLREALDDNAGLVFDGPVEADETFIGGKAKNMHAHKRKQLTGRGGADKTPVVGVRDRATGKIAARVVPSTEAPNLVPFVEGHTKPTAHVYTDGHRAYQALSRRHDVVRHTVGEYVRGMAHTNGIESHWALLKRGFTGTYHQISAKHLHRYVAEFAGRHNVRSFDTHDMMSRTVQGMEGKRLPYADLVANAPEGTPSEPW